MLHIKEVTGESGQGSDFRVPQATGNDGVKKPQIRIHIDRKSMGRDTGRH